MAVPIISFAPSTINPTASPVESLDSVINATERGIRAGQQLPSYGSAIATGVVNAVDIYNKDKDAELNRQLKQEQIEAAQMSNDVKALETEVVLENEDLIKTSKKLELEAQKEQLQNLNKDLDNKNAIEEALASPLPNVRKSILQNPEFTGTLFRDPKYAERVLGNLYSDLSPAERQNAFASLDFSKKMELDARMRIAETEGLRYRSKNSLLAAQKAREDLSVDALVGDLSDGDVANRVTMYPSNTAPLFPGTTTIDRNAAPVKPTGKIEGWDIFLDGKQMTTGVDPSTANKIKQIQNSYKNLEKLERQDLNLAPSSTDKAQRPQTPVKENTSFTQDINPIKSSILTKISLPEAKVALLDPPTENLNRYVKESALNPSYASQPINVKTRDDNINYMSRVVTDEEYDSNPAVREKYDAKAVEEYNKSLESSMVGRDNMYVGLSNYFTGKLIEPYKVTSPKDLYYINRSPVIKTGINQDINNLIKREREKLTRPLNKARANRSLQQNIAANR